MKYRTTKRAVNASYVNRICVGYCNLQYLLRFKSPVSYLTRREGWAADVYEIGSDSIVTGYSPFGNVQPSYVLCRAYDQRAEAVLKDYDLSDEKKRELVGSLLDEFVAKAKAEHESFK